MTFNLLLLLIVIGIIVVVIGVALYIQRYQFVLGLSNDTNKEDHRLYRLFSLCRYDLKERRTLSQTNL